jgi:nucleotide-binding universal stress UspA family protein
MMVGSGNVESPPDSEAVESAEGIRAVGLRVLLAHDLSASAEQAAGLIANASWPSSTVVRVVTSPEGIGPLLPSFASVREARAHAREIQTMITVAQERVAADLDRAGVAVEARTLSGKPERAIVAEAKRFGADLIVVGARGQGSIAATLLGSVSRSVVENAACPVLVARGTASRRVLVATDGSAPAGVATTLVATWPMFADARILVLAVGEPAPRYPRAVLGNAEWRSAFRESITTSAEQACDVVEQAVSQLAAGNREVDIDIRLGDVGAEVVSEAEVWQADIVVVGSSSRPLLHRLFLGTVARKIIDGAGSSVLVARPRAPDKPARKERGPAVGRDGRPSASP